MRREEKQFVAIGLTIIFSLMFYEGLIAIDAAATSFANHTQTVNLFGLQNPDVTYHLGLLFCIAGFVGACLLLAYFISTLKCDP